MYITDCAIDFQFDRHPSLHFAQVTAVLVKTRILADCQLAEPWNHNPCPQITNTPGMLGQTPQFLTSLKAQPDDPSRHLIVIAFDEPAARLCARHHPAEQCVLDDWNTTRLSEWQ